MQQRRTRYPLASLQNNQVTETLASLPDSVLSQIQFTFPLFSHAKSTIKTTDEDGFPTSAALSEGTYDLKSLHQQCWNKFEKNPQISSHVRDVMGRMAGWGFGFFSGVEEIQMALDEVIEDPRNALYENFPKFCGRSEIEGELFLMLTLHLNGFVEVDFITPTMLTGGDKGSGILFHSMKKTFPLFYNVKFGDKTESEILIPSINIAYFPELEEDAKNNSCYKADKTKKAKPNTGNKKMKRKVEKIGGYNRFIVRWDKGFLTRRNVSHIRTTIEWLNYYEDLKKYEIDHKKSSGAYLWVIEMDDMRAFRSWLALSEDERKSTGILQPKDPGGTLILPPGMKMRVENPKLPTISDEDSDIMQMVSSGLNKPQDLILGDYRSTYASVKAAQGPQNDRINDDLAYFTNFLRYNFWRPVFFLKSVVSNFKLNRRVEEVVGWEGDPESEEGLKPVKKRVQKPSYKLVEIALPVSKLEDIESIAKSMLGVKHGSLVDTLNIPREEIAKRLGFYNYPSLVKKHATEQQNYPKTKAAVDQETAQEEEKKQTSEQE